MNQSAKILLVDDDLDLLKATRRILESAGYQVTPAQDAAQALALARTNPPDLMLLDVNLPDISGIEVCRQIKQTPELKETFVVMLSAAHTDSESQAQGLEAGADGYITRPIGNRELLARVQSMLRLHTAEMAGQRAQAETQLLLEQSEKSRRALLSILEDRRRAEEALRQQNQLLTALQNTTLELVSQLDLQTLLENIVKRAGALVGTSAGLLDLIDPATQQLIPRVGIGALQESLHLPVQPGEGLVGTVWQTGELLVIPDYDQWTGRLGRASKGTLGSVIGLPLLSGAEVLGVLAIGTAYGVPHQFDPATIEILKQFARLATVAVQNARLFSNLQAELSERKRAEQALQESQEMLQSIFVSTPDPITVVDLNGVIKLCNQSTADVHGYASAEQVIGKYFMALIDEQDHPQAISGMMQVISDGVVKDAPFIGLKGNGEKFTGELSVSIIKDASGNPSGFVGITKDITERKRAEAALQESEQIARRTAEQLQMVNQMGTTITSGLDFEQLTQTLYEQCQQIGDTHTFFVALYDNVTGTIHYPFYVKDSERRALAPSIIRGKSIIGQYIVEHPQTLYIPDSFDWPPHLPPIVRQPGTPTRAQMWIPLIVGERIVGLFSVQSHAPNAYSPDQIQTLELLATQVAIAVKNSQLYEQIQQELSERKRAEALLLVRMRLVEFAETHSLDQLLQKTLDEVEVLTQSRVGFYHFVETDQTTLMLQAWSTRTEQEFCMAQGKGTHYNIAEAGVWVDCVHQRRPVIHNDYASLPASRRKGMPEGHAQVVRELVVPILRNDLVVAVLGVGNKPSDYDEKDTGIVAYLADVGWEIAERKRTEQALLEGEARFRAVVETANDAIITMDTQGNIVSWNAAAETIFGYATDKVIGMPVSRIVPEQFRPQQRLGIERARAGNERQIVGKTIEVAGLAKDGRQFPIEMSLAEWQTQAGNFFTAVIRDITERKRAEERLRENEASLRESQRVAHVGHWSWDTEKNQVVWSDEMQRIFGLDPATFTGDLSKIVAQAIHPDDQAKVNASNQTVLTEQQPAPLEYRIVLPDQSVRTVLAIPGDKIVDASGKILKLTGIVQDITERQQAEERIRQSEKKYRELFQVNKDGIAVFLVNPHGPPSPFVEVNDAAYTMLGYTREEMLKLNPMMLESNLTPEQLQSRQSQFESKGAANFETLLRHKNGHSVFAEFASQMIQYENQPAVMNIVRDITERKQRENELQAIASLSAALRTAATRAEMLPVIIGQMVALLECDTAAIEMIDPLTGDSVTEVAHGAWKALIGNHQKSDTGINAIISQTRQPYFTNDLKNAPNLAYPEWTHQGLHGGIGAPLIAQNKLIGFVSMGRKTEISEADVRLLVAVADMSANALYRATLHEQTQKDAADLALAYDTTLEGWAHALELRDQETEGHTRRVVQMTVDLARAMGIAEDELEHVRRGALLHDIGKMGIPDSVLLKPGTLNEREWEVMQRHPEYAYQFLEPIEYLRLALDIPYCHHERWDGTGYPRQLTGEQIPLVARIFAIVDVWDALRSDRPYRKAWNTERTRKHIQEGSGKHFDPQVVEAFLKIV